MKNLLKYPKYILLFILLAPGSFPFLGSLLYAGRKNLPDWLLIGAMLTGLIFFSVYMVIRHERRYDDYLDEDEEDETQLESL